MEGSSTGRRALPERHPTSDYSEPLCCHGRNGRNLIVCIDNTPENQFGIKNSNVVELYNLILKEDNQRTWPCNGGTVSKPAPSWKSLEYYKQILYHKIDLPIAWDFEQTVLAAYRWLSHNYEKGDRIFLFGFSYGAYQVRVLSAMISKVGLLYKGNEMQIPFAFELYADPESNSNKYQVGSETKIITMAERFKSTFSQDVKVHFVGAWDTVSPIGIMGSKKMLPGTIEGMKHVCYFRHALALDERRVKFLPEYTYGGSTEDETNKGGRPLPTKNQVVSQVAGLQGKHPHSLEVWFAGTHSDIGGGNTENAGMNRRKPPLRWMVLEARTCGLRTAMLEEDFLIKDDNIEVLESLTWPWRILEVLPFKRLTFTRRLERRNRCTYKPHLGTPRKIHPGQKVHHSVLPSEGYTPNARPLPGDPQFWNNVRLCKDRLQSEGLVYDLYDHVLTLVERLIGGGHNETTLQTLHRVAKQVDGRQAVYDKIVEALNRNEVTFEIGHKVLKTLMVILKKTSQDNPQLRLRFAKFLPGYLHHENKEYQETARSFMAQYTDCCLHELRGHDGFVLCVAFSRDGERVASGSADTTIRIWDVKTGKPLGEPFRGHSAAVSSVAFSWDGECIVSGSYDKTIWIWNVKTREPLRQPFKGHSAAVSSVAFSRDGQHIVSGSIDETIRIWNVKTGEPLRKPLKGHSGAVNSVAFSSDCEWVVSGSGDKTMRIWKVTTGVI